MWGLGVLETSASVLYGFSKCSVTLRFLRCFRIRAMRDLLKGGVGEGEGGGATSKGVHHFLGFGVVGFSVRVLGRWVDVGVLQGSCR